MEFKAKLNIKFYVVSILLLGIVVLGWYGLYFLISNEILMEDNVPMDNRMKLLLIVITAAAVLSWTFSLFAVIRQALLGYAFMIDKENIDMNPFFRVFVSEKYRLFSGFKVEKQDIIKAELKKHKRW